MRMQQPGPPYGGIQNRAGQLGQGVVPPAPAYGVPLVNPLSAHSTRRMPEEEEEEEDDSESDGGPSPRGWRLVNCEQCDWPSDGGMCENPMVVVAVLAVLVLVGIAALISIDSVAPLQFGIRYNHFSKSADTSKIYGPGRYFVGPFGKFLTFPSSAQTIEFAEPSVMVTAGRRFPRLHTRTKDGTGLYLEVSLQYLLRRSEIGRLYSKFNLAYEDVFVSTLRDTLIRAASEFSATQLWEQRRAFGDQMEAMVNRSLWDLGAKAFGVQLLIVDLPDTFERTITKTQVQNQLMQTREMEQAVKQTEAETQVIQADYARQEKVILANGQANYTVITKEADARAQQMRIDNEANVMHSVGYALGIIGDDLVYYQRWGAMDDLEDSRMFFGFGGAAPMLVSSGP